MGAERTERRHTVVQRSDQPRKAFQQHDRNARAIHQQTAEFLAGQRRQGRGFQCGNTGRAARKIDCRQFAKAGSRAQFRQRDFLIVGEKVHDFQRVAQSGEVQLIFERLSDYKALNTVVAWAKPGEYTLGLRFIDPELRRRVVIKRLMPTRWRLANEQNPKDADEPKTGENG